MTDKELAEIEARCVAATFGPWEADSFAVNAGAMRVAECILAGHTHADAEFIAHAREDVPQLLTFIKQLRQRIITLEAKLNEVSE